MVGRTGDILCRSFTLLLSRMQKLTFSITLRMALNMIVLEWELLKNLVAWYWGSVRYSVSMKFLLNKKLI